MKTLMGRLEKSTAIFLHLINKESQHHQHRKHRR